MKENLCKAIIKKCCNTSHLYYCVLLLYILSLLKEKWFPWNFDLSSTIFKLCDLWLSHWTFINTSGFHISMQDCLRIKWINANESTYKNSALKRYEKNFNIIFFQFFLLNFFFSPHAITFNCPPLPSAIQGVMVGWWLYLHTFHKEHYSTNKN